MLYHTNTCGYSQDEASGDGLFARLTQSSQVVQLQRSVLLVICIIHIYMYIKSQKTIYVQINITHTCTHTHARMHARTHTHTLPHHVHFSTLLVAVTGRHIDSSSHGDPGDGNDTNHQTSNVAMDEEEGDPDWYGVLEAHPILHTREK